MFSVPPRPSWWSCLAPWNVLSTPLLPLLPYHPFTSFFILYPPFILLFFYLTLFYFVFPLALILFFPCCFLLLFFISPSLYPSNLSFPLLFHFPISHHPFPSLFLLATFFLFFLPFSQQPFISFIPLASFFIHPSL